jgi:hypothetical protein
MVDSADASEHVYDARDSDAANGPVLRRRAAFAVRVLGRRAMTTVSGPIDQRIASIGREQRGRVARRQLIAAGIYSGAITRRAASGRLLRRPNAVYVLDSATDGPWTRETEVLLGIRDGAVLSHLTALALWGMWKGEPPARVDVSVAVAEPAHPSGSRVHRPQLLRDRDLRIRDGLPVTSPSLALVDSAPLLDSRGLERAFEEGVRHGLTSLDELARVIERLGRRPGVPRIRALVNGYQGSTYTRSEGEELMRSLCDQADLPWPEGNADVMGFEVDFVWPAHKVVLEVDGFKFHSSRSAFERDRRKDQVLTANGFRVIRTTWRQLENDAMAVMVRVGQILNAAESAR